MAAQIIINLGTMEHPSAGIIALANDRERIYHFLVTHGYDHETAASVTGWAELASIGEEYDLDGALECAVYED